MTTVTLPGNIPQVVEISNFEVVTLQPTSASSITFSDRRYNTFDRPDNELNELVISFSETDGSISCTGYCADRAKAVAEDVCNITCHKGLTKAYLVGLEAGLCPAGAAAIGTFFLLPSSMSCCLKWTISIAAGLAGCPSLPALGCATICLATLLSDLTKETEQTAYNIFKELTHKALGSNRATFNGKQSDDEVTIQPKKNDYNLLNETEKKCVNLLKETLESFKHQDYRQVLIKLSELKKHGFPIEIEAEKYLTTTRYRVTLNLPGRS